MPEKDDRIIRAEKLEQEARELRRQYQDDAWGRFRSMIDELSATYDEMSSEGYGSYEVEEALEQLQEAAAYL